MFDLWMTTGLLMTQPDLRKRVTDELQKNQGDHALQFHRYGLNAYWNDDAQAVPIVTAVAFSKGISSIRDGIDNFIRTPANAPTDPGLGWKVPVSLYCAAAICTLQLAPIPTSGYSFLTTLEKAGATQEAQACPAGLPEAAALLGLCQIDTEVRGILEANNTAQVDDILARLNLSLTASERIAFKTFAMLIRTTDYLDAHRNPTWDRGCFNGLLYYDKFNRSMR